MFARLALVTVVTLGAQRSAAVDLIDASTSSEALPTLDAGRAIDGDANTFWASAAHAHADATEWIEIEFDETIALGGIELTPRMIGQQSYAFPRDYAVEYSYDATGTAWFPVPGGAFTGAPTPSTTVTHLFDGDLLARRLRVTATELRTDDHGNYYFQLAEVMPLVGDTVFPFATSATDDFDAQLNMMWSIYGSISDGTDAVCTLGNEPAFHEWMALKYGWSASTAAQAATLRNQRILTWPISTDGYVWSWGAQEPWPGDPPAYHNENNAKYILAAWRAWTWTRDHAWFDQVDPDHVARPTEPMRPGVADVSAGMTLRDKLRRAMQYLEQDLHGALGGITLEDNGMNNDGTLTGDPTNYWDNWKFGYKNAYDNIYYYAALEAMAQLETLWGDAGRAAQLRAYRAGCKADYEATFWDPIKGRFVSTIDRDATVWDFGAVFVNLEALAYGLGDPVQAMAIFDWLDGRRTIPGETSTGADIYHWAFAPRSNTIAIESLGPPYWWADANGLIDPATTARWPVHLENGGAIFYVSFYDIMARLQHLGPDDAFARFSAIIDEFAIDQLRRDPAAPGSTNWQLGVLGEFPESGLVPGIMLYGFAGIQPDLDGLHVRPRLPSALTSITVRRVNWAGALLDLHVTSTDVLVTSDGASTRTVYVDAGAIAPGASLLVALDNDGQVTLRPGPRRACLPDRQADRVVVRSSSGQLEGSATQTHLDQWGAGAADAVGIFGDDALKPHPGDVTGDHRAADLDPASIAEPGARAGPRRGRCALPTQEMPMSTWFAAKVLFCASLLCTAIAGEDSMTNAAQFRDELPDLHVLRHYRAMKNSFVLGLEETAGLPPRTRQGDRFTILDARGQGSLRHIWATTSHEHIPFTLEFFVDGEAQPSVRGKLDDLIHAAQCCTQPFHRHAASIIPNRSHNWYLPVPFDRSLRIDLICNEPQLGLVFLQLDYRLEDDELAGVRLTQRGTDDQIELAYLGAVPAARTPLDPSRLTRRSFRFTGNQTIRLDGPAIIRRLALNKARPGVWLVMRFDGAATNAVAVDVADFFGPFRGTVFNNNACYLPMPYRRQAELRIDGASANEEYTLEVDLEPVTAFGANWGYFHAVSNHAPQPTVGYDAYDVLYTRGRGHWLGMSLYDTGSEHGGGDFAVIDGESPRPAFLHGINGEDYFSFAFFATGENLPYSETFSLVDGRMRAHLESPYPFNHSLHVSWGVLRDLRPRSVAYWYQDSPDSLTAAEQRPAGLRWRVFGQRVLHDLDDRTLTGEALHRALLAALPDPRDLDAGAAVEIAHHFFGEHKGVANGWATQTAVGPYLNLTYVYRHALDLGGHSHMGYYPRALLAATTLVAPAELPVVLELSHDDPLEVELNGAPLHRDLRPRAGFSTIAIPATLVAGDNTLLIRMIDTPNINTTWAALGLRILDEAGRDVSLSLQPAASDAP